MLDQTDPLTRFTAIVTEEHWSSLFPALEELFQDEIGHKLFSCSIFRKETGANWVAARVYSNDEVNYPTSGLKEITPTRWTDIVITERKIFVANTVEGFADVFADHAKIAGLGLGSVINLPVALGGEFIGTVNILHDAGFYTDDRVAALPALLLPSLLAFQFSSETAALAQGDGAPVST